jgi:D-inositol-3-phosphate glycosyltransferase
VNSTFSYDGPSVFGYETDTLRRAAAVSVHTSPLASLGGKDAGGMNVYIRELSCHLAAQGLPVDIFTRRVSPSTPETQQICDNVNVIAIDAGPHEPVDKNSLLPFIPDFAEQMALYALRSGTRYDVVHAHYWLSGLTAELLKRYWNIPYALMFHTTAHMKNRVSPSTEQETKIRARKERRLVDLADSIIAANPDERADLIWRQRAPASKICTIPPGVDVTLFQPEDRQKARRRLGIAPDAEIVLYVGRIDPIKGVDTLLESFAILSNRRPSACLVIIGGDLREDGMPVGPLETLFARARELGIAGRVRFEGARPQNALPDYYSAADVVHVPSRYESFGLVAIEAMASGTPVVASRTGGLIFTIEDGETGFLAPISEAEAHASALESILESPERATLMGLRGHEAAQRFAWESVASSMMHVYRRLAEGHRANLCCAEEIFA